MKNKLLLIACISVTFGVQADDNYPLSLLYKGDSSNNNYNEDISLFVNNEFLPGVYNVMLIINGQKIKRIDKEFIILPDNKGNKVLTPCFSADELTSFGIEGVKFTYINDCVDLSKIEYLSHKVKIGDNNLFITVPQSVFNENRKRELEKSLWDDGIAAIFTNYTASGYGSGGDSFSHNSNYINLQSGVNLGAWRYRNYSTWQNNQNGNKWKNISSYVFRSIRSINSLLSVGDIYTSSWHFDSVKISGAKLETDTMMLPSEANRYTPNVTGIASTESTITIVQNGHVIYQKVVPPGTFDITDYSPTNGGGNLYVTVESMSGEKNSFVVPFSSMQNLKPKGQVVYSLSTGKYDKRNTIVSQVDVAAGITRFITLLGGAQVSSQYNALSTGFGANLGQLGAFDISLISAKNDLDNKTGMALKANLSKSSIETGTNFSLMINHILNNGFSTFSEAMDDDTRYGNRVKDNITLTLSQQIFEHSQIGIGSSLTKNQNGTRTNSFNASFSSNIKNLSYSLYINKYIKNNGANDPWSVGLNLSIPFSVNNKLYWANSSSSYNNRTFAISNSASGSFGENNQAQVSVNQSSYDDGRDYSYGISANYGSPYGNIGAGYSESKNNKSINYNASGAITLTQYGASIGNTLSDTNSIVLIDGVSGIENSSATMRTNGFGVGVQPGLSAYRENFVYLNTKSIPDTIDINESVSGRVIPTRGAIVLSEFNTKKGNKLYITMLSDKTIPMGAIAKNSSGEIFLTSIGNKLYLTTEDESGEINVSWKEGDVLNGCKINYDINNVPKKGGIAILSERCN